MSAQPRPNTYDDAESLEILRQNTELKRGLGALTLSRAAAKQGARIEWISTSNAWATLEDRRIAIDGHCGTESVLSAQIVNNKHLAKELMGAAGISVPAGRRVTSADEAIAAQREIDAPVVVKPTNGAMGRGVTVNIVEPEDIRTAFARATARGSAALVEQYIEGDEYRAHATPEECVGVFKRLLPSITGDGESTVAELVRQKNASRKRNPSTGQAPIPMDAVAESFLRRKNMTWDSVVPAGERVVVRDVNGITSGGDSEECLVSSSTVLKETAAGAIASIPGMDWGGVDILVDHRTSQPYVMEINTRAAINGSTYPTFGSARDLGTLLWQRMVSRSAPEVTDEVQSTPPSSPPHQLLPDGASPVTLQTLLQRELQEHGHTITTHTMQVWSAKADGKSPRWFSTTVGEKDLLTAVRQLRYPVLRNILQKMKIPRATATQVASLRQLENFRDLVKEDITIVPTKMLSKGRTTLIPKDEAVGPEFFEDSKRWFAQVRRPGLRFKVLATVNKALTVVAEPGQETPTAQTLRKVCSLAVSAVRAVPQLRWACVDIMHLPTGQEAHGRPSAVVERYSINPHFDPGSTVVAGRWSEVAQALLD